MGTIGPIDITVILLYLVGIAALGIYQTVKVKSSGDFFAGGRKFSKWLMVMHSLGTGTHADDPVGVAGASYQRGISGIWYTYVYLFLTPFYWVIAPFFRRSRYITTADFFEARFGKGLGALYAVMGMLTFAINTGTILKGTGRIATAVTGGAVPEWMAIWAMTIVFVVYGFFGGLIATVITESIQGVLIVVMSLLLIPFGLNQIGWFSGLHDAVDPQMFSLARSAEITVPWIIAGALINLIGIVAQPHIMECCSTGKTEWEGRVGFTYGNFIKRFCAMGWTFTGIIILGMAMKGTIPTEALAEERELAFGVAIRYLLPVGFTGLMFASILAAQMSTLSAFMVAGSALLTRNLIGRYLFGLDPTKGTKEESEGGKSKVSDATLLYLGRFMGLVVVALGVLFAYFVKGVAEALLIFWAVNTFTGLFMWFGVLWRRTNPTGAWLSFAVMFVLWFIVGPFGREITDAKNLDVVVPAHDPIKISTKQEWLENVDGEGESQPNLLSRFLRGEKAPDEEFSRYKLLLTVTSEEESTPGEIRLRLNTWGSVARAHSDAGQVMIEELPGGNDGEYSLTFVPDPETVSFIKKTHGEGYRLRFKPDPKKPSGAIEVFVDLENWSAFFGSCSRKKDLHWMVVAFLPIGIIVLVLGSIFGPRQDRKLIDDFYLLLKTPVGQEKKLEEAGVPVVYHGETKPHPWETHRPRLVNIGGFLVGLAFAFLILLMVYGLANLGA